MVSETVRSSTNGVVYPIDIFVMHRAIRDHEITRELAAHYRVPAFGVLLSPIFAGAAMALSSVSVVTNALRLRGVALGSSKR